MISYIPKEFAFHSLIKISCVAITRDRRFRCHRIKLSPLIIPSYISACSEPEAGPMCTTANRPGYKGPGAKQTI